ncbi:methyltransferase [Tsuneonella sp. YG55]|uniref:Methyltransferase n=1 Tax=Tsuneonella litorea TaxID=2976475 RepID=A0A9X3A881_9SPHN|nr:methyltransferase [Tsuneonella litorea]MCT2559186.1 methyltransferase [Tsuneonella litorea]
MKPLAALAALSLMSLGACATMETGEPLAREAAADPIAAAVASPDRPEAARALDASRKPVETLRFLGLRPGMAAADLLTGTGYWAEIMGHVVGPKGEVVAYQPAQFYTDDKSKAAWAELVARSPAVREARYPFDAFAPPARSLDFALINLSYHDLYWTSEQYKIPRTDPDAYVRALYAAMKPGGVVGVIDHVGHGSDTRALVDKLHRIDPAVVRADFARAGFRLAGQSDLLANPADDHTVNVFDPSIRGRTDRFLYKFVKPR